MTATPSKHADARTEFACVARAWQAHEAELRGYLCHRLGDEHAAEDLLQEVFLKAMRQGRVFCSLESPRAWLFQVARNALVDRARTVRAHEVLTDDMPQAQAQLPEPVAPVDALAGCVARVLSELAPQDAAVLRSCDLEGRTVREFAQSQGLGLAAAKSRLLRARERMRHHLVRECQVRFDSDGSVGSHVPREHPSA